MLFVRFQALLRVTHGPLLQCRKTNYASSSSNKTVSARRRVTYNPETLFTDNVLCLPRLPIPNVIEMLERYKTSVIPLSRSDSTLRAHMARVERFAQGTARKLNDELKMLDSVAQSKAVYPFSFVESVWDEGYLRFRGPSPINVSPAVGLRPIPGHVHGTHVQETMAATYIHAVVRWYRKYMDGQLDLYDDLGKMCIAPLDFQFGCSRVPGPKKDTYHIERRPGHIIVLHRGHVFQVEVMDRNGRTPSPLALSNTLLQITTHEVKDSEPYPVGVLTACGRDDCAAYLQEIQRASQENERHVRLVQSALLVVCLDTHTAPDLDARAQAMLHGVQTDRNNRWFDRHQMIVSRDGYISFNFEHAFSDPAAWNRWLVEIWHHVRGTTHLTDFTPLPPLELCPGRIAPFRRLVFDLPSGLHSILNSAQKEWENASANVSCHTISTDLGRRRLTSYKVSPDAFVQMALHLTYYRMRGVLPATYESCSTARFFHGRTDTIRSATTEMKELVSFPGLKNVAATAFDSWTTAQGLAHAASARHVELSNLARSGYGIDRHLLALKSLAHQSDDAWAFFDDYLFGYSGKWVLSSSNMSSEAIDLFCLGPVTPNGYGIGYSIHEDRISIGITSFRTSRKTSSVEMRDGLIQSMRDLSYVLSSGTGEDFEVE